MKCEMIWKIWKKSKLKSEKIWKIWKKGKLYSEMIWKIWKIYVLVIITPKETSSSSAQANRGQGSLRSQASSNGARVRTKNKCLGEGLFLTVNSNTINEENRFESTIDRQINARATSYEKGKKKVLSSKTGLKLRKRYEITKKVRSYEKDTKL